MADGHQGQGWDTVQIQVRPQHAHQLSGCPLPGQKSPQQGSGAGSHRSGRGLKNHPAPRPVLFCLVPLSHTGAPEYQRPAPLPAHSAEPGSLESQIAPPLPPRPWGRGGKGQQGAQVNTRHSTRLSFLLGRPLNGESREGQGIKAALGTTSPRLLSWSLGPLLMPFWGGGVHQQGVGEGAHPEKVHLRPHLHRPSKTPAPSKTGEESSQSQCHGPSHPGSHS